MKPGELQVLYSERGGEGAYIGDDSSYRFKKIGALMAEYREPRKVLDVGCAAGTLLKPYAGLHHLTGVDISSMLLAQATRNGYQKVLQVDVSTQPLPFADKSFDLVFCGECIEHVVDTDWALCEMNRVLKPGGHLLLTFPNIRTPISMLMMFCNLPPMLSARYRSAHVRDFTTGTMRLALQNCGFRTDLMWGSDIFLYKIGHCFPRLAKLLPSWASSVVARAVKERDAAYAADEVAEHEIFKGK